MTTSDYLEQLQQDKQDLVDNLTEKGITGLTGDETFTELVPEVLNIKSGSSEGWQRPSDWWDTKTILENAETKVDNNGVTLYPVYIILFADVETTTAFDNNTSGIQYSGDGFLTSDGAWYGTSSASHTWNKSKDKPCSEGYKTRYVIVYRNQTTISSDYTTTYFPKKDLLEVGFNSNIFKALSQVIFGNDLGTGNTWVKNVFFLDTDDTRTLTFSNKFLRNCYSIQNISFPNVKINLPDNAFYGCYCLQSISFSKLISIGSNSFNQCYSLTTLTIPDTNTSVLSFSSSCGLRKLILPNNYNIDINLKSAINLSYNSLLDIISKLKDLTGTEETHTITLGATNKAKLSAEELQVITDKGWTLGS